MLDLESVMNAIFEGAYATDTDGEVLFFNRAAENITGWRREDIIGKKIQSLLQNKTHLDFYSSDTEKFTHKNGHLFPVEYTSTPLKNTNGNVYGIVVTFRNIAERMDKLRIALNEVEKSQKESEAAHNAKSEFLINMSHELRTPMHAIMSLTKISMKPKYLENSEKQEKNLKLIVESGKRLLTLLDNLLDLSKLESETVHFNLGWGDLREVVDNVTGQVQVLLNEKDITLDIIEPAGFSTSAVFDIERIKQVLWNLISNAIHYSPRGGTITIAFENASKEKSNLELVSLSIIDQGIGIPKEEQLSVFDKFIQSSKTKTGAGGTGLGLSISKEIIEAHGGKIWVEDNINDTGAIFAFTIPKKPNSFVSA